MNKLIISILSSLFIVIMIWFFQGYVKYGDDIVNYRIDLKENLKAFDKQYYVEDVIANLERFSDLTKVELPGLEGSLLEDVINFIGGALIAAFGLLPIAIALPLDFINLIILVCKLLFSPSFVPI